jgi:lysozyme family protein
MANFLDAYKVVMGNEGGYANDSQDSGGETWKGISRNNFPDWRGWKIVDRYKGKWNFSTLLSQDMDLEAAVQEFYKAAFWDALSLDYVKDYRLALELFDTAVNCGVKTSGRFAQIALNVLNNNQKLYLDIEEDGIIGPQTLRLINNHTKPASLLKVLNVLQGARYIEISRSNHTQEKFMNAWLSRVSLN